MAEIYAVVSLIDRRRSAVAGSERNENLSEAGGSGKVKRSAHK
ncbi:MAG: hypothetical protein ABR577_16955 [Pyrinomonadaceae bacterium]